MGKIFEVDEGKIKVTTEETKISAVSYKYDYLLEQKAAIEAQKLRDNTQRDLELAEVDLLISEAKKLSLDVVPVIEEPVVEQPVVEEPVV